MTPFEIQEWHPGPAPSLGLHVDLSELARLLHAVVHAGASVNFVLPFSPDDARSFWTDKVLPATLTGQRRVLIARADARIVGTVQLNLDTPPNQAHRADVTKLLVHPQAQGRGLGRQLMTAIEALALSENRKLLTLDTRTGDKGESLYKSLGFVPIGTIAEYSKHPFSDELESATFFYKRLI